jgi:hypothetical protein
MRGQRHVPAVVYPRERPNTHCAGGWVGPRAGLDRCEKSRPYRDSIPGPSSPYPVTIPTELPGLHNQDSSCIKEKFVKKFHRSLLQAQNKLSENIRKKIFSYHGFYHAKYYDTVSENENVLVTCR